VAATLPTPSLIALHDAAATADRAARQGRRYEYDLIRAGAALLLFLCHFFGLAGALPETWHEWIALSSFFQQAGTLAYGALLFLSGYFIARSMNSAEFYLVPFLKRRFAILLAPYACTLVAATTVSLLAPGLSKFEEGENPVSFLFRQFLLLPGLFPEAPMLTVAWLLPLIAVGLLVLPLWNWPVRDANVWKKAAFWGASTVGIALILLLGGWDMQWIVLPAGTSSFFLARAIETKVTGAWIPLGLLLAGLALGIYLALSIVWQMELPPAALSSLLISALLLIHTGVLCSSATDIPKFLMPLRSLGESGYSFYLLHGSITKVMLMILFPGFGYNLSAPLDLVIALLLCFGASIVGSQVLYRAVEKPLRENIDGNGERRLSEAERQQVIESLQPRGQARYSRADAEYR
jgi:peptidoglycan/LPS O-acetylase OafA/YrhL